MNAVLPNSQARLIRAASYASVAVAITLVAAKAWAWNITGSVALLSSLADSILDIFASLITFAAIRIALQPADAEHRFGHGKSEGLAALAQSLIVGASAAYVCFEAVQRFLTPADVLAPESGAAVMILSLVLTISLVAFQRLVVAKTGSVAIEADAMHYRADVLVNVGVLATIALVAVTGWQVVDPLVGLLVAAYILVGAVRIARRSLHILLDRELDTPHREAIRTIAMRHPAVRGFHDLRTRFGGNRNFLQFHLELDPSMNLLTAHEIMDTVEADIRSVYPGSEIIIHADPEGVTEPRDTFD